MEGVVQQQTNNDLPIHGDTLRMDLLIPGTKFFSDAAWKTRKATGMASGKTTSIGYIAKLRKTDAMPSPSSKTLY
jgi:hypothetical protein